MKSNRSLSWHSFWSVAMKSEALFFDLGLTLLDYDDEAWPHPR